MFLRSLTMKGFKSFADPTVLEFEPGVTVVVGPNGSGKSNVVDAVTWVLGAQGPRQLRSAKMEDVIFAGTASRSALGRAEVSLTIDNSSGDLAIETAEVTITRTLFRNGDSEYALNGTPCRLLDIQELLSDTGIGRSQHMIIGQGQLDAVLQARPEERRSIIEEAAGVLKHRRRRERAERRLAQTQENLERLGDLVREVRRQMRPLERQAIAARSHASLADELRDVRVYVAGQELAELIARRDAAEKEMAAIAAESATLRAELQQLDDEASEAAAELSSRREETLAGSLGRVQSLIERARGSVSVLNERHRSVLAALDASADVDVVSNLEAEAAHLHDQLVELDHDRVGLDPDRRSLISAEADLIEAERGVDSTQARLGVQEASEARAAAVARAAEARRRLSDSEHALNAATSRLTSAEQRVARRADVDATLVQRAEDARHAVEEHTAALRVANEALDGAEQQLSAAEAAAEAAADRSSRSEARAEALTRSLEELEGQNGREALQGLSGVIGALVDLVEIDEGWERAVEAAAGASVGAVVVDGRDAARAALRVLRDAGTSGLVLAPSTGQALSQPLPTRAAPLREHIRPRSGASSEVNQVLDALFGRAVLVDALDDAMELSLDRPDLIVVTMSGDRFATSGWRVHSTTGVVTRAAVEQASATALSDRAAASAASTSVSAERVRLQEARSVQTGAARLLDRSTADVASLERELASAADERAAADLAVVTAKADLATATTNNATIAETLREAQAALPDLDQALATAQGVLETIGEAERAVALQREELNQHRRRLAIAEAELEERSRVLDRRRVEIERRLEGHAVEREQAAARRLRLEHTAETLLQLRSLVEAEQLRIAQVAQSVEGAYQTQMQAVRAGGERLEELRNRRSGLESSNQALSNRQRANEVEVAELGLKMTSLTDHIERELGSTTTLVLGAQCPPLPEGIVASIHANNLAAKLQSLGPINPLALEELSALEERHRDLDEQVSDVRTARRDLQQVIGELDAEIVATFASAVADVNEHFSTLVAMLFPGGTGRLVLSDPDDLLNTGVEIEVRPMGRNVRRVSLLSGGERSMAALAFSFAIFRSRPSPFYLMDEVEAALDDVNLHRFLGLIEEFRDEAQLIIVSHQKRTMEAGDALYGVTMKPGGSSQVVSQKVIRKAPVEEPVATP